MKESSENVGHAESLFIDSGAHSLYNAHVLKLQGGTKGRCGRELDKPNVLWSQGDFSFFDLSKGSPFRQYCDRYAEYMKSKQGFGILFANVDVISNPDLTWEVQRYFEEEHGVQPAPIIHYGTPMRYVDRYVETGKYKLLGVGGLGQGVSRHEYFGWGDQLFERICPRSNGLRPIIQTHGFAMTSWELICRWPWWSVDSATWVKLSAYGWVFIPRWGKREGWRMDLPPYTLSFSAKSPRVSETDMHYGNAKDEVKRAARMWLEKIGMPMGSVDADGKLVDYGVVSHHRARSIANLHYLKDLEESRPPWPWPLDFRKVDRSNISINIGMDLDRKHELGKKHKKGSNP